MLLFHLYRTDWKRHLEKCVYLLTDAELQQKQEECERICIDLEQKFKYQLDKMANQNAETQNQMELEIQRLQCQNKSLEQELERLVEQFKSSQKMIEQLAQRAIDKPTTTTVNNNQRISNILCDPDTYAKRTNHDWIRAVAREKFEPYFWQGQRGVAQFMVDHIIKAEDGKMLICCTDPSRNRFRYLNADNHMKEDIEARIFTQTISVPIKSVCNEVFDQICKKLHTERQDAPNAFKLDLVDKKIMFAHNRLIEIRDIDNEEQNGDFKSELAVLLNV